MSYKIIVLAPSAGGKSTLMRYLRDCSNLEIAETDEEVMKANGDVWPDDGLKNTVLIPQTTKQVIKRESIVYLASYIPEELIKTARDEGFIIVLLDLMLDTLKERNQQRMSTESYADATPWLQMQLNDFARLLKSGLIDVVIDGNQPVEVLAKDIVRLAK
jgi:predicted ABC-type ATPase